MAVEFKLPELGENIDSGDVVKVLVKAGETLAKDQAVLELETEKVTVEVPSTVSGKVKKVHVKPGDKVKVGQVILTLDEAAGAEPVAEAKAERKVEAPPAAPPIPTAEKRREERVVAAETAEEPAEETVTPRAEVVDIRRAARPAAEAAKKVAPAAPSVRRMARELGVDINDVPGSGPGGRISVDDVRNYARSVIAAATAGRSSAAISSGGAAPAAAPVPIPETLPDFSRWGEVERQPMRAIRRKTAEHMAYAWATIPHVTQFDRADITEFEQLRKQYAKKAEAAGGKLTVTAILLKVVAAALRLYPQFAASLDMAREEIIYKKYCHIGVAVDTDRGLLVPVIRDVDRKNILEISAELTRLAERAREKKLTLEEMEGGVFSITNLGGIGGTGFSPIVNSPEVAILGVARASTEGVWRNGQLEPRLVLPLSLSYDHRLIDGAAAARFLRWVAEALEQPFLLALEG